MRLFEIELSPLYATSKDELRPGSIMEHPHACDLGTASEMHLERRRPETVLPRDKSLRLLAMPPQDAEYVYLVQPIGQVDRFHTSWLKKLQQASIHHRGEVDQYATGFFSGEPILEDRDAPWEYRAMNAKVLKRVGGIALAM